jgi:hypothetical protein
MNRVLCVMLAALPLVAQPLIAQPKLLVNAQTDTKSAAAGLEQTLRPLIAAPQPAWIAYSVPSTRAGLGCDYVRDGWNQPGVIHLEPPDHVVILYRVEGGEILRIRSLSPDCEIDAGNLPFHWLNEVKPAESVAFLNNLADKRDRYSDSALNAIALHSDPSAEATLKRYLAPNQPSAVRVRAVNWFGFPALKDLAASDPDERVRERAISRLGSLRQPETIDVLIPLARKDTNPRIRMAALSALNRRGGAKILDTYKDAIDNDPDMQVKRRALSSLQSMPDGEGIPLLIQIAKTTKDNEIRKQAMSSLGNSHDMRALTFFEGVLK